MSQIAKEEKQYWFESQVSGYERKFKLTKDL